MIPREHVDELGRAPTHAVPLLHDVIVNPSAAIELHRFADVTHSYNASTVHFHDDVPYACT